MNYLPDYMYDCLLIIEDTPGYPRTPYAGESKPSGVRYGDICAN